MRRIPNAREVDKALKAARSSVKATLKGLNQIAGQTMAKGRYEEAQALVAKAKEVLAFDAEIEDLRKRWKAHFGAAGGRSRIQKKPQTPLWAFYQPVLQSLIELGGSAPRRDIEPIVGRVMGDSLQAGDYDVMGRGWHRWQRSVYLTHKQLLLEGWIEKDGRKWVITSSGRRAAKASPSTMKADKN